jgi:hypothetical protein
MHPLKEEEKMTSVGDDFLDNAAGPSGSSSKLAENVSLPSFLNVKAYGATGNGTTDDTQAFINCLAAAGTDNYKVFVPAGNYKISQQLTLNTTIMQGAGVGNSTLTFSALGSGVPAIIMQQGWGPDCIIREMTLQGPNNNITLGVKNANCDGVQIGDASIIENCLITGFDSGVVVKVSHSKISTCKITKNYYGIYFVQDGGDNLVFDCAMDGNAMAGIGVVGTHYVGAGTMFLRCHTGYSPYGIYGESATASSMSFITECIFDNFRFEECGNGAIFTERYVETGGGGLSSVVFRNVGFSWGSTFKLSSKTQNYAVQVGMCAGTIRYEAGGDPFSAGASGIWYLGTSGGTWVGDFDYKDFNRVPSRFHPTASQDDITINGATAGTVAYYLSSLNGGDVYNSIRKIVLYLNGYKNSTTTADTITHPMTLGHQWIIVANNTGMPNTAITTSNINVQLNPHSSTAYTGFIVIEGGID